MITMEIFKAGKYPQGEFTVKELAEIANSYNPSLHEAPATIGHVSDYHDSKIPAYGWIGKVFQVGDKLKVAFSNFSEELKGLVGGGYYKKVSAGFYKPDDPNNPTPGKWHLHHVAFLGAQPPAVKGLEAIAFSDSKTGAVMEIDFAEESVMEEAVMLSAKETYEAIQESFATCLSKVEEALAADVDDDTKRQRVELAISDCYGEVNNAKYQHFAMVEGAETITEKIKKKLSEMKEQFTTKRKESIMDLKEFKEKEAELAKKQTEFAEQQAALKAQQDALAAEKAAVDAKQAEFAEKERKEADAKLDTQVSEFKEDLIKKGYPVKKMEEQGFFAVAKNLLKAEEIEFKEEGKDAVKKKPFEVLAGVVANFTPTPSGTEFDEKGEIKSASALAKEYNIGGMVDLKKMETLQFVEMYAEKHADKIPGQTKAQKRAHVQTQINMGQLKADPSLIS